MEVVLLGRQESVLSCWHRVAAQVILSCATVDVVSEFASKILLDHIGRFVNNHTTLAFLACLISGLMLLLIWPFPSVTFSELDPFDI